MIPSFPSPSTYNPLANSAVPAPKIYPKSNHFFEPHCNPHGLNDCQSPHWFLAFFRSCPPAPAQGISLNHFTCLLKSFQSLPLELLIKSKFLTKATKPMCPGHHLHQAPLWLLCSLVSASPAFLPLEHAKFLPTLGSTLCPQHTSLPIFSRLALSHLPKCHRF